MALSDDRVAVVTGGAGGIGRASCAALSNRGYRVVAVDLERPTHGDGLAIVADVGSEKEVGQMVADVESEFGPIALLVTAAGIARSDPLTEIDDTLWRRIHSVNLDGTFLCCREVGLRMQRRRAGTIVTMASELALSGGAGLAHYCAAKGAVIGLTKALALELAPWGVRVNCVVPGPTDTPMLPPEERTEETLRSLALGRLAAPEEIAAAVCFLASDAASHCIGTVLSPNCGAVI